MRRRNVCTSKDLEYLVRENISLRFFWPIEASFRAWPVPPFALARTIIRSALPRYLPCRTYIRPCGKLAECGECGGISGNCRIIGPSHARISVRPLMGRSFVRETKAKAFEAFVSIRTYRCSRAYPVPRSGR